MKRVHKKLSVHKEALRTLTGALLDRAAGGNSGRRSVPESMCTSTSNFTLCCGYTQNHQASCMPCTAADC